MKTQEMKRRNTMKALRNLCLLLLFSVFLTLQYVAEARQQIGISPSATNSYAIPPERTTNSILFDLTITGDRLPLFYRYISTLDGQYPVTRDLGGAALGFILHDNLRFITYGIGHGLHTVSVTLQKRTAINPETWDYVSSASTTVTLTQYHRVTVQTSYGGGTMYIDGEEKSSGGYLDVPKYTTLTIRAKNNWDFFDNHWRKYRKWVDDRDQDRALNPELSFSFQVDRSISFTASYGTQVQVTVMSQNPSSSNISYDGQWFDIVASFYAFDDDPPHQIAVARTSETYQRMNYTFAHWLEGSNVYSSSPSTTIQPTRHTIYTAAYDRKPLPPEYVTAGGTVGNPVLIYWERHPHPLVTYEIWRKVKRQGQSEGPPVLVATADNQTGGCVDNTYLVTNGYTHDLLWYDVRAYYPPAQSYSDPEWVPAFGRQDLNASAKEKEELAEDQSTIPPENSVSNYPNPFNPTTTIVFKLKENSYVTLEIFDASGRLVKSLVPGVDKAAGHYSIAWNGKDNGGSRVSSGAYLYRFIASPSRGGTPYLTSGKLLLLK